MYTIHHLVISSSEFPHVGYDYGRGLLRSLISYTITIEVPSSRALHDGRLPDIERHCHRVRCGHSVSNRGLNHSNKRNNIGVCVYLLWGFYNFSLDFYGFFYYCSLHGNIRVGVNRQRC